MGLLVLGTLLGSVASTAGDLLSSPEMRDLVLALGGEQGLTDAFLAAEFGLLGTPAAGFAVQAVLRLRMEEVSRRSTSSWRRRSPGRGSPPVTR